MLPPRASIIAPITLVLDTNVVIDWLVFSDPFMNPLRQAATSRQVIVLTSVAATDELKRVLGYPQLKLDAARQAAVFDRYVGVASPAPLPGDFSIANLLLPPKFPHCRDADDQHFFALAWHSKATMLVSRDKAVLKLRRRAAKFGVTVVDVGELIERLSLSN